MACRRSPGLTDAMRGLEQTSSELIAKRSRVELDASSKLSHKSSPSSTTFAVAAPASRVENWLESCSMR